MLLLPGAEEVRVGFGVRCSLSPSAGLLAAIADANQRSSYGCLWLTDGSDETQWALMWTVKLPYRWFTSITLQRCLYTCVNSHARILGSVREDVLKFGGREYWGPMVADCGGVRTPGLVLLEHLG